MSSDPNLKKFETDYADIIRGEIGNDTIESQKAYSKYVKNDNSLRYIDRDIEANYTNSQGISLTRMAPSTKVAATNSTQNISIDEGDYDRTTVSLRKFFEK